jgi:hypothetical protein
MIEIEPQFNGFRLLQERAALATYLHVTTNQQLCS